VNGTKVALVADSASKPRRVPVLPADEIATEIHTPPLLTPGLPTAIRRILITMPEGEQQES
jgi:hypothetical protein